MSGCLGFVERIKDLETGGLSSNSGSILCELCDAILITQSLQALTFHLLKKKEVDAIIPTYNSPSGECLRLSYGLMKEFAPLAATEPRFMLPRPAPAKVICIWR